MSEEPSLAPPPPCVASYSCSFPGKNPVAGNDNRQGISGNSQTNSLCCQWVANTPPQLLVRDVCPPRNSEKFSPYGLLECRSVRSNAECMEMPSLASEVLLELLSTFAQDRRTRRALPQTCAVFLPPIEKRHIRHPVFRPADTEDPHRRCTVRGESFHNKNRKHSMVTPLHAAHRRISESPAHAPLSRERRSAWHRGTCCGDCSPEHEFVAGAIP